MSNKYICVLVEGSTEEKFVNEILKLFFNSLRIYIKPVIVETSRTGSGKKYKGGISSYKQVNRDLKRLIYKPNIDIITTMIDYYKLPEDFPGYEDQKETNCYKRIKYLESRFAEDINHHKFIPYFQLHEFEAYLFSSIDGFKKVFSPSKKKIQQLNKILSEFNSPEEIDEGEDTSPSKRIKLIFPEYDKIADGILIAEYLGLNTIRKSCSHFNNWLEKLTENM